MRGRAVGVAPAPYSFVIPALNEAETITSLLVTLRSAYPCAELIVVDGGSSDATADLARPLCDQMLSSPPGRARQMNLGLQHAGGEYVFFLHADTLPGASAEALISLLQGKPEWGFCRVKLSGDEWYFRLISALINTRSTLTRVATGDQMQFFRRKFLLAQGGFADIPLMEDVEVSKRLRHLSPPLIIPDPVTTSSRRWREGGVIRTIIQMWLLRLAYFLGVSPARLRRHYYGEQ